MRTQITNPNPIHNISKEFQRVGLVKESAKPSIFFSNRHKSDREWDVLGATSFILRETQHHLGNCASKLEKPDFVTYLENNQRRFVEITEAIRPNYKRHEKFREEKANLTWNKIRLPPRLDDPWTPLQQAIDRKASGKYDQKTVLIIYYGLWIFDMPRWSIPVEQQIIRQHLKTPFRNTESFEKVFVLTSGMNAVALLD